MRALPNIQRASAAHRDACGRTRTRCTSDLWATESGCVSRPLRSPRSAGALGWAGRRASRQAAWRSAAATPLHATLRCVTRARTYARTHLQVASSGGKRQPRERLAMSTALQKAVPRAPRACSNRWASMRCSAALCCALCRPPLFPASLARPAPAPPPTSRRRARPVRRAPGERVSRPHEAARSVGLGRSGGGAGCCCRGGAPSRGPWRGRVFVTRRTDRTTLVLRVADAGG